MAQWVRAFASQAEGWVFESQPRQTLVEKTGSDSSIAKCWAIGVVVMGPRGMTIIKRMSRVTVGMQAKAQSSWVPSIGQNLQLFALNMSEKFSSRTKKQLIVQILSVVLFSVH